MKRKPRQESEIRTFYRVLATVAGASAIFFGAACGGAPPPNEKIATSEAAIRGAQEAGADRVPKASLHLKLAQEGVTKAKAQIEDGDNEGAELTLMRAQVDAELAHRLSKESSARAEADQAMAELSKLKGNLK